MKLLPFERFQIETGLTVEEVHALLSEHVGRAELLFQFGDKRFCGVLYPQSFKISRSIKYRNSFLPVLTGEFEATDKGTIIEITSRMNFLVMAFLILIVLVAFFIAFVVGIALLLNENEPTALLMGLAFLLIGVVWPILSYWSEEEKAKAALHEILDEGKSGVAGS